MGLKQIFRVDELVASKLRELLKSTMSKKHAKEYFNEPVNCQKLKLITYHQFIKSTKALGQVILTVDDDAKRTFESKTYQCTQEFAHDVRLVFKNCFLFNQIPTHHVFKAGRELAKRFEEKLAAIESEIEKKGPPCGLRLRCQMLLTDMRRNPLSEWFRRDDWKKFGDDYTNLLHRSGSHPMDLSMMQHRLDAGQYDIDGEFDIDRFAEDGESIWRNAIIFNGAETMFGVIAQLLSETFARRIKDLRGAPTPPAPTTAAPDRSGLPTLKRKREYYKECLLISGSDANRLMREVEEGCKSAVTHTEHVSLVDIDQISEEVFSATAQSRLSMRNSAASAP